ncbi:thiamine pyrophosphate-dependent dehydrogenase E1 component subunit alpha [Planctomycetota bacterium]
MDVTDISREEAEWMLRTMQRIRQFEDKVFELLARDLLKGASHVYAGEEAVAVGACAAIQPDDYIASTHRGHGHCLAKGGTLKEMMAELCGKSTGYCKGRGGSMHIADVTTNNLGATGIVGSNIPVAAGAGLACQMLKNNRVVLCFFGDGASNTGSFHESLNMAATWKLPVVFVCENNLYGMSVAWSRASSVENVADRGPGYNMPSVVVDGMDVLAVKEAIGASAERVRAGGMPEIVECKTYRYRGHSRSDPRKYRTKEEEKEWRDRDPIVAFKKKLTDAGVMTHEECDAIEKEVEGEIADAEKFAVEESQSLPPEQLYEDVYVGWIQGDMGLVREEKNNG